MMTLAAEKDVYKRQMYHIPEHNTICGGKEHGRLQSGNLRSQHGNVASA